ncbi:MAG: acyltransferase [Pseudomonadota bacterium]
MSATPPLADRIPGIDVLRGLAVLLVTLHHINLRFVLQKYDVAALLPRPLSRVLFSSGYYSVIVFFVISGFLITALSLRRWGSVDRIQPVAFYRLRVARLLPCLLLLLAVLSFLHLAQVPAFSIPPERASLGRALVAALGFHVNWLEGHRGYLPGNWDVLWSLSVEETFYLLFPLACLVLHRESWLLPLLLALIAAGPFNRVALEGQAPWEDYHWLSGMDGIAFGCIAGWISVRRPPAARTLHLLAFSGLAFLVLIVVFRRLTFDLGLTRTGLNVTVLELGTALLLIGIAGGVGRRLAVPGAWLVRLAGRCSYEIYLTHMFVLLTLTPLFRRVFPENSASRGAYALAYVLMLALSVLLGVLLARYFSEPLNRWLRGNHGATGRPKEDGIYR